MITDKKVSLENVSLDLTGEQAFAVKELIRNHSDADSFVNSGHYEVLKPVYAHLNALFEQIEAVNNG